MTGLPMTLDDFGKRPKFLGFLSTACFSCEEFAQHLSEVAATWTTEFAFAAICRGDVASCRSFAKRTRLTVPVIVDEDGLIEQSYEVSLTPFGSVLDERNRVLVRGVASTWTQIESLLAQEGTPSVSVQLTEMEHH